MKTIDIKALKGNAPVHYKQLFFKDISIDEEAKKVSGYLAVFGNKDDDGDILIKGCFAKSIRERGPQSATSRKIAFLWMHDIEDPIGRFKILREDDFGLYFEAELDKGVESADRALLQLKSGTLDQFSIGYQYIWENCDWDTDQNALICKELNLYEGSVVTLGANELTYFAGMKSSQKKDLLEEIRKETEIFIKSLPDQKQYIARRLMAKNINFASAGKKKKDDQSTAENDDTDNVDMNLKCVKDAIGNLTDGMDICDDYAEEIDNEDLIASMKAMKESHAKHLERMEAHKCIFGGKALDVSTTGKPLSGEEPEVTSKMFNNLTLLEK